MANIKLTELTELLTADVANTILYAADLSVSPNVSHYIKVGSINSLTDYSIANAAFLKANTAFSVGFNANSALNISNLSFDKANSAHLQANIATVTGTSSFTAANSATVLAQSAFNRGNSSFIHANSAFNLANTTSVSSSSAFSRANSAFTHANSAFNLANTTSVSTSSAFNTANSAFNRANNSVLKSGDTISGIVTAPTAANNTSNTMIATTQFVQNVVTNAKISSVPTIKAYAVVSISGTTATLVRGFNIASVSRIGRGVYTVTFTTPMSQTEYSVNGAVSTYNPGSTNKNYDHIINVDTTTTNSVTVNTSDARGGSNNTGHDVAKFWISIIE
jgi:hypothetical protein